MADDAIPAATLVMVRDRPGAAPELLMVERSEGMAFAAGALVFPGGRIDQADHALGDGAAVAAVRETIEETAVPVGLRPLPDADVATDIQRRLISGETFRAILADFKLELDLAELTQFARWVPKFHAVRRFDTMFYVAQCPPGYWQPRIVEGECAAACWICADEALAREASGEARLIFPTRRNLERLALHRSFAEILADALAHPIEPVTPWVDERDGEKFITIPSHLGYPVTEERLDGLWRG